MSKLQELSEEFDPQDDMPTNPYEAATQIERSLCWLAEVCDRHGLDSIADRIRKARQEAERKATEMRVLN